MAVRARPSAHLHLDKALYPQILSYLSWPDQIKAGALCQDALKLVSDARLVGARWTRGDFEVGRLSVPARARAFHQTRIESNNDLVVYVTSDGEPDDADACPVIVRSTKDLGVRAVHHDFCASWAFALWGDNLIAAADRTNEVKVMSVDDPTLSCTFDAELNVCDVDANDIFLLVRTWQDVRVCTCYLDEVEGLVVELHNVIDAHIYAATQATRFAPSIGPGDPSGIFIVPLQEEEGAPSRLVICHVNIGYLVASRSLDSPTGASRFPYHAVATSSQYIAALTYYDSFGSQNENYGIDREARLVPRMHVYSADFEEFGAQGLIWDLAEDVEPKATFCGRPCIAVLGSLLLSSSLSGLAICAWCLKSGTFLYRCTTFFEHPHRYAVADSDDHFEYGEITDLSLTPSKDALLVGCWGAKHFVVDATGGAYLRHTDMHPIRQRQHVISRLLTRLGEKSGLSDDIINTQIAGYLKYKNTIHL